MPLRDATTRSRAASHLSAPCADQKVHEGQERLPRHDGDGGGLWCHHFAWAAHFLSVERPLAPLEERASLAPTRRPVHGTT